MNMIEILVISFHFHGKTISARFGILCEDACDDRGVGRTDEGEANAERHLQGSKEKYLDSDIGLSRCSGMSIPELKPTPGSK